MDDENEEAEDEEYELNYGEEIDGEGMLSWNLTALPFNWTQYFFPEDEEEEDGEDGEEDGEGNYYKTFH